MTLRTRERSSRSARIPGSQNPATWELPIRGERSFGKKSEATAGDQDQNQEQEQEQEQDQERTRSGDTPVAGGARASSSFALTAPHPGFAEPGYKEMPLLLDSFRRLYFSGRGSTPSCVISTGRMVPSSANSILSMQVTR